MLRRALRLLRRVCCPTGTCALPRVSPIHLSSVACAHCCLHLSPTLFRLASAMFALRRAVLATKFGVRHMAAEFSGKARVRPPLAARIMRTPAALLPDALWSTAIRNSPVLHTHVWHCLSPPSV